MNYARIREAHKKKLAEKKQVLAGMSGADRTKLEQHLLDEAKKEVGAEDQQSLLGETGEKGPDDSGLQADGVSVQEKGAKNKSPKGK